MVQAEKRSRRSFPFPSPSSPLLIRMQVIRKSVGTRIIGILYA